MEDNEKEQDETMLIIYPFIVFLRKSQKCIDHLGIV